MKKVVKVLLMLVVLISFTNVYAEEGLLKTNFIKKDDKGNLLDDAEFKQMTLDGHTIIDSIKVSKPANSTTTSGKYFYANRIDGDLAYLLLTPSQKSVFDNMGTLQDYYRIKNLIDFEEYDEAYCSGKQDFTNFIEDSKGIRSYESKNVSPTVNTRKYQIKKLQTTVFKC